MSQLQAELEVIKYLMLKRLLSFKLLHKDNYGGLPLKVFGFPLCYLKYALCIKMFLVMKGAGHHEIIACLDI